MQYILGGEQSMIQNTEEKTKNSLYFRKFFPECDMIYAGTGRS
ncbi:hypothetical protein TRKP067_4918 [Klebsiella pneumoniae]|uniref:Uncharacterized protein n=1 Tax=Klebsiella pneumoniae TaxID=573 RepID=A0A7S5GJ24_KLEPN|nr:hypothetical protein pKpnB199_00259 [Klebsiella pneumoniae]BBE58769.1 hypothetical protein TRKP33_p0211 [Klebsiella pneumoniae]BBE64016.1 hypothetical protein TRKP064_4922 [Klebsiella pneumoniae]BBE69603.1 hypothetical protein TRKP067_4918 [Klebsiella pneumoniae]